MDVKELFNTARSIPLPQVLDSIGAQEDKKSNENHSSRSFNCKSEKIIIKGQKFIIVGGKSGGGGIDLLLALGIANKPLEALNMLNDNFSFPSSASHAPEVRVAIVPAAQLVSSEVPLPVHSNFQHVKDWLIFNSSLDSQPSSLRHRSGGTIEAELVKTLAVCC